LQKRLPALTVVLERPKGDAIYFGAQVEVRDDAGKLSRYRLVGPDETDARSSAISIDSPLARALLTKCVGDEISVRAGDEVRTITVVSIHYPLPG